MQKPSSITFLSAIFSIIFFSIFVSMFPNGINMAHKYDITCENNINFYGGIKGNGSILLYADNFTIQINENKFNGSVAKLEGYFCFYIPSALYSNDSAEFKKAILNGTGYLNMDGNISHGKFDLIINGNIGTNISNGNFSFMKSKEKLDKNFDKLALLPFALDEIFYIEHGNGSIDGSIVNFSNLIFRGNGNYHANKFSGKTYLIFNNKKFFDTEDKIFYIPSKIIFLWGIAIILSIISIFLKGDKFLEFDKKFYGLSFILGLLFLAITLFLWINQANTIFGKNAFQLMNEINLQNIIYLSFIILPYLVFIGLIAFPIRLIISSIFDFLGFINLGKAVGRSLGFLFGTWLGIFMLPSILNLIFYPLFRFI